MKKIYLAFVTVFLLSLSVKAQVMAFQYPSEDLNEETIEQIVKTSRAKGTQEWELVRLREHLYKRLEKLRKGEIQAQSQRGVNPSPLACNSCTNVGFESGNTSGWTLTSGDINYVTLPCNTCATGAGGIANVVNSTSTVGTVCTSGIDACSGLPVVAPGGGNNSLLLNDNTMGGKMQEIKYPLNITAANNVITYQYLAVLEDGGHAATDQPYFFSQVLDGSNNAIACTYYMQSASASISGWTPSSSCASTNYKGWVTVTLDMTSYIGQCVTLEFLVSDCNQGGHFGYAYIDANCDQIVANNTVTICPGSTQLCGPSGYNTYSWTGPVTGNTMCLNTGTAGQYTLTCTGQCPAPTRFYTVNIAPTPTLTVNSPTICAGGAGASLTASGAVSYTWSPTTGLTGTGGTVTANPATTTTYTLTGANAGGCTSSVTTVVTVNGSASVTVNNPTICPGNTVALTASGASTYTWSPSATLSSSTGSVVVASPTTTTVYTINATSAGGCTAVGHATVTIGGSLTPTVNSPSYCAGGSA
ncbi:MAG: immunoglobulin domain-containing protein, partial [Mucilaginibacter sp.]